MGEYHGAFREQFALLKRVGDSVIIDRPPVGVTRQEHSRKVKMALLHYRRRRFGGDGARFQTRTSAETGAVTVTRVETKAELDRLRALLDAAIPAPKQEPNPWD